MPEHKKTPNNFFLESGIKELSLLRKHFHIAGNGDSVSIRQEITPTDVTNFYKDYFTRVRPQNLGFDKILPAPDSRKLRALYMGNADANILLNVIVRHVLYVDQILVVDPFLTVILQKDHPESVLNHPELWVSILANRALCLCALEEWIKQGIILLFPDMFYYHPELLKIPPSLRITPDQQRAFEHTFVIDLLLGERPENRDAALDVLVKMGRKMPDDERAHLLSGSQKVL